mgnify:CR=1 FL=1
MLDIEKMVEQLNDWNENLISELCADDKLTCDDLCDREDCIVVRAAKALSTLQAENERLRAELEKVKAERDAAVSWAQKYTESINMPCVACKHNTGDYVCTAICGNCGPMGAESCKWEFDFSGELKED